MVKGAVLLAVFLLAVPQAPAGVVHSGSRTTTRPAPAPLVVRSVSAAVTISFAVAPATLPATETAYLNLRGPDGQVRRFPVEGGAAELSSRVIVLRPGESATIRVAAK
jgi:hypothetical protein